MNSLSILLQPFQPQWLSDATISTDLSIQWVIGPADTPQAGDLLLLPADDQLAERIKIFLNSAVSAIGIVGPMKRAPSIEIFPIPIFSIENTPATLREVQRDLLVGLLNANVFWAERGMRIQSRLTQIVARSEGLPGLAAALCDLTQHSILIQDKRLTPLASSPAAGLRLIWEDLLEGVSEFSSLPEKLRDRRQVELSSLVMHDILPGGLERVIVPIVSGEMARGYLSIIAQSGDLDETDTVAAEQGALVCAVEMARAKAVRETEKRLHGDLLSALLHQNLSSRDAQLWAHNTGLDLEKSHTAMRLAWEGPSPSLRRLETILNDEAAHVSLHFIVSQMGGELIAFCETPREAARPADALALALAVIDRAAEEFTHAILRCGIGTPAPELADWQVSFRQAGQSLDMARRLDERKPLYFMDLSIYRLLMQIEDHPDLRAFMQETLGPILSHENAAEFLSTLEEYFAHNGNVSQTAEAMFIHRNTLLYRMERIASISKLDLDNSETRLAAQLALRIHRMLRVTS